MIRRVLLLVLVVTALTSAIPPLRARVAPAVAPVLGPPAAAVWDGVRGVGTWASDEIYRWSVRKDVQKIAEQVRQRLAAGDELPDPGRFSNFLLRHRMAGAIDPWGSPYYLLIQGDSFFVGSAGPDAERDTDDDLLASSPRR